MGVISENNIANCAKKSDETKANKTKQQLDEILHIIKTAECNELATSTKPPTNSFPGLSEISPNLFLCGAGLAIPCFLKRLNITCVINVAPELPDTPLPDDESRPAYVQIPVLDRNDLKIDIYFDEVSDLIDQELKRNGKCMVHCVAGVSRSASLCLAYLMKYERLSLRDAFFKVRAIRPQIQPNTGFFRQLIKYESNLFDGKTSVKMVFKESLGNEIPDVFEAEYEAMERFYQKHRHLRLRESA